MGYAKPLIAILKNENTYKNENNFNKWIFNYLGINQFWTSILSY